MSAKKWRCRVCGYIHEGEEPPEICPLCGAPKSEFELVTGLDTPASKPSIESLGGGKLKDAVRSLGYGLYVVSSRKGERVNAQTANTVFQITAEPVQIALGINKENLTHEFISKSRVASVTVLGHGDIDLVKHFGFRSGRDWDKFAGIEYALSDKTGCPVVKRGSHYLDLKIVSELDAGTHTLFLGEAVDGGRLRGSVPLTYAEYHANRAKEEQLLDGDIQNVIKTLNLEYAANRRYQKQIERSANPRINAILEGIMRTEGDHVDNALRYLRKTLDRRNNGFRSQLLDLMLALDFEEIATGTYRQLEMESDSDELKEMFREMARSEAGHINIFKKLLEEVKEGVFPVAFYCPVCGWELDYGSSPGVGDVQRCQRCGAKFALKLVEGDWSLERTK